MKYNIILQSYIDYIDYTFQQILVSDRGTLELCLKTALLIFPSFCSIIDDDDDNDNCLGISRGERTAYHAEGRRTVFGED